MPKNGQKLIGIFSELSLKFFLQFLRFFKSNSSIFSPIFESELKET